MAHIGNLIGNTRLLRLDYYSQHLGVNIFAKVEFANPGSSIKDRPALSMIERAEEREEIAPQRTVLIEPTSGNTGIALAMIGASKGYKTILTMPESMSQERRSLLASLGAELVLTPAAEGMAGAVAKAEELASTIEGGWIVGQFVNPDNPRAHEETTAPEIHKALGAAPDVIVAGVGTGGTITGCARYFAAQNAPLALYAVQPAESPIIGQALKGEELTPAKHGIQGIGANFIPKILELQRLSGAISVSTEEALCAARDLSRKESLMAGISSGANIVAVAKLLEEHPEYQGKTIVTFMVDTAERYISTPLFA